MLLSQIAFTVFKKAIIPPVIGEIIKIFSLIETSIGIYNCIETINECEELGVTGLKIVSGQLSEAAYDTMIKIDSEEFSVQKTSGGIYVASKIVPDFVATPSNFPEFAASPKDFPKLHRR